MTEFSFTLTVEGADILADDALNALYEAGCDDATFGVSDGVQRGEFEREAVQFAEAVASAIKAVEAAVPGARVVDVHREPEVVAGSLRSFGSGPFQQPITLAVSLRQNLEKPW